jgi:hypothetical protein
MQDLAGHLASQQAPLALPSAVAGKRVCIVQSNYIPWKGYFDMIRHVDEFILYDDVQYTRRDWRNRNKIKGKDGTQWLTIPVEVKGKYFQRIRDTVIDDSQWAVKHWRTLAHSYAKAPCFPEYKDFLEDLYRSTHERFLSEVNYKFLRAVCQLLGIRTPITWSMQYTLGEGKTEKLLDLCQQAGATEYLSGPAAQDYLDESAFLRAGIRVRWMDYSGYPEYPQVHPPFDHGVSILDLLLHTGAQALQYMKPSL